MQNNLNFQKTIKTRKNDKLASSDKTLQKPIGKAWKRENDKRKIID